MSDELPTPPAPTDDGYDALRDIVNSDAFVEILEAIRTAIPDYVMDRNIFAHIMAIHDGMTNLKGAI